MNTSKIPGEQWSLDGGGLGSVVSGVIPVMEMHEKLKDVTRNIGVEMAGQGIAGLGKLAWREQVFVVRQCGTRTGLQKKVGTARKPLDNLED